MRFFFTVFIIILPVIGFADPAFSAEYFQKYIPLLEKSEEGCIALGWSKTGDLLFATTEEPEGPVGGYYVNLIVFNTVYDFTVVSFRIKEPTEKNLDKQETAKAVVYLNKSKILPGFQQLQKFPLKYKGDSYIIAEYTLRERIKTKRNLKLQAEKSGEYKTLDVSSGPERVKGYFKSPFENRIAVCWYVPPMGGPAGANMGGGYYAVSGCLMETGFLKPEN